MRAGCNWGVACGSAVLDLGAPQLSFEGINLSISFAKLALEGSDLVVVVELLVSELALEILVPGSEGLNLNFELAAALDEGGVDANLAAESLNLIISRSELLPEDFNVAALVNASSASGDAGLLGGNELLAEEINVIESLTVQTLKPGEVFSGAVDVTKDPHGFLLNDNSAEVAVNEGPDFAEDSSSRAELATADERSE